MHCRNNRHGPRWQAFADHLRDKINEGGGFGDERRGPGGFGGRRGFGGGRGPGRVLDGTELRLVLLKLIWEEPRHGYELIKAIEALSGGVYAPSPGMVYPTLTLLTDLGQVSEAADGSRKRFTITEAGAQILSDEAAAVSAAIARLEDLAKLTRNEAPPVRRALRNLQAALGARLAQADEANPEVQKALQLDIAAILDEAASRIERL